MMRFALLIGTLLLLNHPGNSQPPPELHVTRYNESNGISNGSVTAMLQGKNGYLWFGTTNGLLSFDSYVFRQYNNPVIKNTITRLAEDSTHCIWMSFLGGGIGSFNPATGVFTDYKMLNKTDSSLAVAEITALFFDSKGQLWIGTAQKGLIKAGIKENSYTEYDVVEEDNHYLTPEFRKIYNTVYDVYEDTKGMLWLATHDGLYCFNPLTQRMNPVREKPAQYNKRRFDLFRSIVPDNDVLWLGAWAGGISSYNKKTGEWKTYLPDSSWAENPLLNIITRMAVKNKSELWLASPDMGLGLFNTKTKKFYFFNSNKDFHNIPATGWAEIITDKDKNLWGLNNDGLLKLQPPNYKFLFTPVSVTKHSANVFFVTEMWENERLQLLGTSFADGLQVLNKRTGKKTILPIGILPDEEPVMVIRHIMKDSRNNIWIISRDSIYQYDALKNELIKIQQPPAYSAEKPSNSFSRATEDRDGNIWFTTRRNGVFLYNTIEKKYIHYSNKGDPTHFINASNLLDAATDIKKRVWLGGPYGFIGYVEPVTKKIIQLNTANGTTIKLPGSQTYSLLADREGNIWAGTNNGLCYFDCRGVTPSLKKIFRAGDGLRSNLITDIRQDANGNIWCNTEAAICVINYIDKRIISYGAMDGITRGGMGEKIVRAPGNTMRLLTSNGYYDFHSDSMVNAETKPPLVINRMMVNAKEFYYEDMLKHEGKINLAPEQNLFSFEFSAIDFNRPDKHQYSYMLEGFDKEWINAGSRRFVSYTNIQGGNYTFKVRVNNSEKISTGSVIAIPLFINTPFYKTYAFYLLLAVLVAVFLYWLYRNRINHYSEVHELQSKTQLLEKEKALVMYEGLKQQLNPHFLFNSLTSLGGLIQANQKLAGIFLEQMSAIYRYILKNSESETVSLSEEIKFVTSYIQLQQTRFKSGLQVNINIDEDYYHRKIAPVTLENLVENAIKHNIIDSETPLIIDMFCEHDYLVVQNNLQKKDFVESSNRHGLANMQSLYKYLSRNPIIISEEKKQFMIKIPLI